VVEMVVEVVLVEVDVVVCVVDRVVLDVGLKVVVVDMGGVLTLARPMIPLAEEFATMKTPKSDVRNTRPNTSSRRVFILRLRFNVVASETGTL
jgi:hypothetical protein